MSKLFMYATLLEGIEQLMMMAAPNFQPRKNGIVINNYLNYEEGDKSSNEVNIRSVCDIFLYII